MKKPTLHDIAEKYEERRRALVERRLRESDWNLGAAADALGVPKSTVQYLLDQWPALRAAYDVHKRPPGRPSKATSSEAGGPSAPASGAETSPTETADQGPASG